MVQHLNVPALKKQWVLDAQWTDCPEDVEKVIQGLWSWRELGNDNYMFRASLKDFKNFNTDAYDITCEVWEEVPTNGSGWGWVTKPLDLTPLINYLVSKGIKDEEEVILHWWW